MKKPSEIFDRDHEWAALTSFVESAQPGATLGLVYGRRRQGKTFLLETVAEEHRGFYFAALRQSSAQNLERLADQYQAFVGSRAGVKFRSWEEALTALLALGDGARRPVPVVIDEFPYLLDGAPELPSLLQALLSPRGKAVRSWKTRLILCGSALTTMRGLLSGTAPLRGRASLELLVHPFDYRNAATYWGVQDDPVLAMQLHAVVGGTAAYKDMCGGTRPASIGRFDRWVVDTLLDPASAMFREGNVLLSEEERVTDAAVYFATLMAISQGKTRRSEIASVVGKSEAALAHPLTVLNEARLVLPVGDALKQKRTTYHLAEPALRFHQLVITPNEQRLSRHLGAAVWSDLAGTVASNIYGPHFEHLARTWCSEHASSKTLGGSARVIGPTEVACREHGISHEVDVVVVGEDAHGSDGVVAIGEAKWTARQCGVDQLHRLEHIRDLLGAEGAKVLLFARSGFTPALVTDVKDRRDIELVDVQRLYHGE